MATSRTPLKVVVLGNSGVGKTSLMNRFVHKRFSEQYKSTIGIDLSTKYLEAGGRSCSLQIWDTQGQELYRSLAQQYYRGADCCVLVFDVTDPISFENLDQWRDEFFKKMDLEDSENFPFVVVANKIDLDARSVSTDLARQWCHTRNDIPYFETSAKLGHNIDRAFQLVAEKAVNRWMDKNEPKETFNTIDLRNIPTKNSKSCTC